MKGLIFNIQRYSIHDGGGIRTLVFFKGCPLKCPWCCNPESQSSKIEKGKIKERCIKCKECSMDFEECPSGAIVEFGKYMSVDEVINEVKKDMIFYNTSGGGVTLSGGEVLNQSDFAVELLKKLKELGVNTAIETSGQGKAEKLLEISKYTDLILFDLKIMDEKKAKDIIFANIELIKDNFKVLLHNNLRVIPRVPLIPNYTMDDYNINLIVEFLISINIKEIHILPFHQYGSKKYEYINKKYSLNDIKPPSLNQVNEIREKLQSKGFKVNVGGL
ncbi:[formate-C-acetyltransferase]-activating enzyme [Haloimpatiens sp. FM7315]|uniref:[formate-C-acetyltransferase]-activating enzyme n=1 Tax=Haloimpatiens sp. FM7315 TaxID=3298609 RepID=UPI003977C18A